MHHLEKSFNSFFDGETKVAVIKGEWGVGKTYFWEKYISTRISSKDISQIAYSYISLFGKSSLDDVRKSVFHNAKAISTDDQVEQAFDKEFEETSQLFNKIPWIKDGLDKVQKKAPLLNWFSRNSQNIPVVGKFSGMISSLEYCLVKNYVVCFDDMERKGKGLSVKEVMGLVDELAQRKNCKVVLIFNESSLDNGEDQKQFESYREKVVDIEVNHNPTCKENLEYIFSNSTSEFSVIEKVVNELGIKNIRVLRKLKWVWEKFSGYFERKDDQIRDEFLQHATLLCWGYYIRNDDLTYDMLKEELASNSWLSYFSNKDKEISLGQKKYRSIATNLSLNKSMFDSHICFFLENGYYDEDSFIKTIDELVENAKINSVNLRLRDAWNIYSDSFDDNINDFKSSLMSILNEEIPRLNLSDFSSAIGILKDFGDDVSQYITNYIKCHSETLIKIGTQHSWDMTRLNNDALKEEIQKLHAEHKRFNLDDISMKIAENHSWHSEDLDFLCSLSKEDYKSWMKVGPEDLITKVRGGLLRFRNLGSSNQVDQDKYRKISDNVVAALQEIAAESEFNRRRIQNIYEIE